MNQALIDVIDLLQHQKLIIDNEKHVQQQIENLFIGHNIPHKREYYLDNGNIIDFLVYGNIGIEVKVKGGSRKIHRQCERYYNFDVIESLILLTSKSLTMPLINGKKVYILNISRAWI